jgi:hypothetical protein
MINFLKNLFSTRATKILRLRMARDRAMQDYYLNPCEKTNEPIIKLNSKISELSNKGLINYLKRRKLVKTLPKL